jgi:hypothetical protein
VGVRKVFISVYGLRDIQMKILSWLGSILVAKAIYFNFQQVMG